MTPGSPTERPYGGPGFSVLESALATVRRHGMLEGGETVVVAVSGGPDSMCLWDVLWRAAPRLDLTLVLAHVDHGLSPASEEVAARVGARAAEAGFDVHVARAAGLEGPNLHERARIFRYRFFETIAQQVGASLIATGHTLDDRVETTLARLVHGAGSDGLAGIPPSDGRRIRPLSDVRRAETRAYCEDCSIEFHDDAANEDDRFDRASVRRLVLNPIEERWGDGAVRAMARSSERLREDAVALSGLADVVFEEIVTAHEGAVRLETARLALLPRALRRRVLERAVGRRRDRSGGIDAVLDALEAGAERGARFSGVGGVEFVVVDDHVEVRGATREPGTA